jgi:predicted AlkP superfamily pyrophosphatase or phosphodiesterase
MDKNNIEKQEKIDEFIKKVNESKQGKLDLSADEDLSIGIMNLISIEEHFFFTAEKTQKPEYFDLLKEVREMRKDLLKRIIKEYEGEVWCISKHLLAASMRLMEVGTKHLGQGEKKEAEDLFSKAYNLYSLFWGLNLKLLNVGDVKKIDDNQLDIHDEKKDSLSAGKHGFLGKLGDVVKKAINCCIE